MLVRTRIPAAVVALSLSLSLAGCDGFDARPAAPATSASETPPAASAEDTYRLAKPAADAALAAAKKCTISAPPFDDAADHCPVDEATGKALTSAVSALTTHVRANAPSVPRDAAAFAETVARFEEWVRQGLEYSRTRGTLRLFQDVADAWNAYRPKEPLAVDPVEEYGLVGYGSKGYIMKPLKKTDGRVVWKSCYDGPCLWESHW